MSNEPDTAAGAPFVEGTGVSAEPDGSEEHPASSSSGGTAKEIPDRLVALASHRVSTTHDWVS
jgi:hypothetical protein